MKRVGMSDSTVEDFKLGKKHPKTQAKGKSKTHRLEREEALQGRMTASVVKQAKPKVAASDRIVQSEISGGQIRGMLRETMARVYGEIWPGMTTTGTDHGVDIEIGEEAYILTLTMAVGNMDDSPRKGLKMKDAEISDNAHYCQECEAA